MSLTGEIKIAGGTVQEWVDLLEAFDKIHLKRRHEPLMFSPEMKKAYEEALHKERKAQGYE